jgi:predicted SprT family Zn-dependent metalloprotease
MNQRELQTACRNRIEECFKIAEAKLGVSIPRVPVVFENRSKTRAGAVHTVRNRVTKQITITKISLSNQLLHLNGMTFVNRTPAHEAAHVIELTVFKQGGHGSTWQRVMRMLGQDAERCHNMTTPERRTTKTMQAFCKCKDPVHKLTPARFARLHALTCRSCRSRLSAAPVIEVRMVADELALKQCLDNTVITK